MKRARRWIAGVTALVALGSCVEPQTKAPAAPATVEPAWPVRQPQIAAPVARTDFTLKGNLTQGGVVIGQAPTRATGLTLNGAPIAIAPDGRFLIAFDRDAAPTATLSVVLDDGRTLTRTLTIAPRGWDISRLNSLPKYPVPAPQFEKIRPAEIAQINAARRIDTGSQGWRQPFLWPATGRISTLFGSQRIYRNGEAGAYHSGIDIAVPEGTPVLAPADGVVVLVTDHPFLLEGNLLLVDHGMGLGSAFMHLSRIVVTNRQTVRRGQIIAYSGRTGRATGPHLHWGLRWRAAKIDPLLLAGPMEATP